MKYFIAIMLILLLVACTPKWSQADNLWYRIDVLQKVMVEQSRMARETKELRLQNIYMDRLAETSAERDRLIAQYIKG